ncbi:ABC transporter transmembrane domain-containing protein [Flexibacterium corallicola]|uniref:ABC transporter transmembrane domain-containing protein n=1 Tax=Flexibacterium corallicola TaxID=3037259 RepID=UPI00286ED08A|nr:ABC transporter transmembrane domain-containing protein [Pseudovibrio sp. M1P-2-3]
MSILATPKIKDSLHPLIALFPYLKRHQRKVYCAIAALIAAAVLTLLLPLALRQLIDDGFSNSSISIVDNAFLGLFLLGLALAIASALRYYYVMWIGERVVADIRSDVFAHLTSLSPAFFDRAKSGEIISRLAADTTLIKAAFGASASIALRQILLLGGGALMMAVTSPTLSIFVLVAIPLIVLPLIAFGRSVKKRSRTAQDSLAETIAYATEALGSIRTLQSFLAETHVSQRFSQDTEVAFTDSVHAVKTRSLLVFTIMSVTLGSITSVIWVGALSVIEGTITAGELAQFIVYSILAAGALSQLAQVWGELSQAAGAAERLAELLATSTEVSEPIEPQKLLYPPKGSITFDRIKFSYPTTPKGVIDDLSVNIKKGETVAIVGPSGSGKSTIFQLLMRFYDPTKGKILLDDIDLQNLPTRELRRHMALVPQDTAIFHMSVADNISYGSPNASLNAIMSASKQALAEEFILKMDHGYDTIIGERGVTLSGGQRQRIAIARAILKDAPILLLDEATSALDAESEKTVQQALDQLMQGRTTLVIAHRLATVLNADRIIVLENGRIIETGKHQELIAKNGLYSKLAKLQFTLN